MNIQQQNEALNQLQTIRDMLRFGASVFNHANLFYGHGTDNSWDEALALVLHALNLSYDLGEKILDARLIYSERSQIIHLFNERISKRLPVPYITHEAWFAGLPFYVDPRVLIPRSPIAELIENHFQPWIDIDKVNRILDIGTGSGCIAIACAHYFPDAMIDAVDISEPALKVAAINTAKHQCSEQVQLIHSDLFANLTKQSYDIIIANPPYVDKFSRENLPKEYLHEPDLALAAGENGLDYIRIILQQAKNYLAPHGILIAEVGDTAQALMDNYPNIPFIWLEFARGGEGVFLLTREHL